jgi:hypothetical protein
MLPVLLVRSPRDEAAFALTFSQICEWLIQRIGVLAGLSSPWRLAASLTGWFTAVLFASFYVSDLLRKHWPSHAVGFWTVVTAMLFVTCAAVAVAVTCAAFVFSRDFGLKTPFLRTSVEPVPAGAWKIYQLPSTPPFDVTADWPDGENKEERRARAILQQFVQRTVLGEWEARIKLWHSATYIDPRAQHRVVRFIASSTTDERPKPSASDRC